MSQRRRFEGRRGDQNDTVSKAGKGKEIESP